MDPRTRTSSPTWRSKPGRGRDSRTRKFLVICDVVAALAAVFGMYVYLRYRRAGQPHEEVAILFAALVIVVVVLVLVLDGQYVGRGRLSRIADVGALFRATIAAAAFAFILNFMTKGFFTGFTTISRVGIGIFFVIFLAIAILGRLILAAIERRGFSSGRGVKTVIVLGSGDVADEFRMFLDRRPWLGTRIGGQLDYVHDRSTLAEAAASGDGDGGTMLGIMSNDLEGLHVLDQALDKSGASEIVVALDEGQHADLAHIATLLTLAHVPFRVVPSLFEQSYRATELLGYGELPVIDVDVDPINRVSRSSKRVLDLTISIGVAVFLSPLLLLLSTAVALESGLPVIYKQERIGKHGRHFMMFKFRTMVKDADKQLEALLEQNEAGADGLMFKMRRDPRVTRVGSFLRKTSLDELPQFFNVLKGDMSVVGPRPPLPREVELYEQQHLVRLRALPGITGLWQVSGRSDLTFEDMVRLDRYYVDNWSLGMDLGILLRTFVVVLGRKGAY